MTSKNLVLRTVYLSPTVDDELRDKAYSSRKSKNDLIRMYIEMGMKAERDAKRSGPKPAAAKKAGAIAVKAAAAKKAVAKKAPAKKTVAAKLAGVVVA